MILWDRKTMQQPTRNKEMQKMNEGKSQKPLTEEESYQSFQ
jgi:hypothetical protein